jgi:tetratricopeptide (TPR) repeat protein
MFLGSPLVYLFSTLLASPFLLLLIFVVVRSYFVEAQRTQRARAAFRQNLEAATLNPADASAHYNLGLLHQQRKEYAEARARFLRAVEIDPGETDAHYQLGRIARAEARLPEAIGHFGEVVARDDAHAQHEVWREVGATYLAAVQFGDARDALERFLARRPSDPEALYLMGRAAEGLGERVEAREWMQRCVEAVRTAPAYKYRADKRWLNEAQQFLRTQA